MWSTPEDIGLNGGDETDRVSDCVFPPQPPSPARTCPANRHEGLGCMKAK